MDSSARVAYGHSGCTCFHPLFVFNQCGDLERCALRPGNVHSADGREQVLEAGRRALPRNGGTHRLSCRTLNANAVWFQLHALAYNIGNFLRTLATPDPFKDWSLTSRKERSYGESRLKAAFR